MAAGDPIVAILNCYAPDSGNNVAQVILRVKAGALILGDQSIAKRALERLAKSPASASA